MNSFFEVMKFNFEILFQSGGSLWKQRWHPPGDGIDYERVGKLGDELSNELWIWRPILAGKCSLEAVLSGDVDGWSLHHEVTLLDMFK